MKAFRIKEGNVKSLSINGQLVWQAPIEECYPLYGDWVFNNSISGWGTDLSVDLNATMGGEQITRIIISQNPTYEELFGVYAMIGDSAKNVYWTHGSGENGWKDSKYRKIEFDGIQYVSREFYEWFTMNAQRDIKGYWLWDHIGLNESNYGYCSTTIKFRTYKDDYYTQHNYLRIGYTNVPTGGVLGYSSGVDTVYDIRAEHEWVNDGYRLIKITSSVADGDIENRLDNYRDYGYELLGMLELYAIRVIPFTVDGVEFYAPMLGDEVVSWDQYRMYYFDAGEISDAIKLSAWDEYGDGRVCVIRNGTYCYVNKPDGTPVFMRDSIINGCAYITSPSNDNG